jgi:two-component system, LytTR family, response regulator
MLRCFIADDEAPARERLRRLLASLEGVSIVGEAGDGLQTLEQVTATSPDVLFLDIDMPELDGLGVAEALPETGPAVIFVTAYEGHALRAFELAALDYLVKPVSLERLEAAVARARARGRARPDLTLLSSQLAQAGARRPLQRLAVRCGARFIVFDPAQVHAILARDHYAALLCGEAELLSDDSLEVIGRRFDPAQFLRVHRSAIINITSLRELVHEGDRRYFAVLSDRAATRVPVSRERLASLKAALGIE